VRHEDARGAGIEHVVGGGGVLPSQTDEDAHATALGGHDHRVDSLDFEWSVLHVDEYEFVLEAGEDLERLDGGNLTNMPTRREDGS
jgi:hypothetical protein